MSIRSWIKNCVSPYPRLFLPLYRLTARPGFRHLAVGPDTDIVFEGFPRSANTYAVVAFETAQQRPVTIAHHTHAEAQVLEGARLGIPVVVLIRRPADAIASLRVMERFDPDRALDRWIAFHRAVLRVSDRVVVADFETVTSDMGGVIDAVNATFGTRFDRCDDSEAGRTAVFAQIDAINAANPVNDVLGLARPSEDKLVHRNALDLAFDARTLAEANALFDRLTAA
ncbi:hypothetical protein [Erythrobacter litoralis]|uniref:Sulfotransferase domain-containing protein n=1 Tax=Erythrobacter litoralis (strain HTCC2594) TaxID=314225 RepID=Q2N707_ERYLH|nr:hypothetical protein [Erythrobacter litoralis]ABC64534.1 hypothetical protein ELI_12210 [Erythrobacter litoralis HTCC2594]